MSRSVVVLPAPFGSEQAEHGPGRDVEVEPVHREHAVAAAEALGEAATATAPAPPLIASSRPTAR